MWKKGWIPEAEFGKGGGRHRSGGERKRKKKSLRKSLLLAYGGREGIEDDTS